MDLLTPSKLLNAVTTLAVEHPSALLIKNVLGNLAIVSPDDSLPQSERYLGYIDLETGVVHTTPPDERLKPCSCPEPHPEDHVVAVVDEVLGDGEPT